MAKFIKGHAGAVDRQAGNQKGQRPEYGYLAPVVFPENVGRERHYGDGKQHAPKGDDPPGGEGSGNRKMVGSGKGRTGGEQQGAHYNDDKTELSHVAPEKSEVITGQ